MSYLFRPVAPLAALVLALPAAAEPAKPGTYRYLVTHEHLGEVGEHRYEIVHDGPRTTVTADIDLEAKLVFVTVRHYYSDRKEVWENGRLVSYQARTDDDGEIIEVSAHAEGDKLVIERPDGRHTAPGDIFPTSGWDLERFKEGPLLGTETGEVLSAEVEEVGPETVTLAGGGEIETTHYRVTGDLEQDMWYDARGMWVKLRFKRDGDRIDVTLIEGP